VLNFHPGGVVFRYTSDRDDGDLVAKTFVNEIGMEVSGDDLLF
jgi:hypothetical protein